MASAKKSAAWPMCGMRRDAVIFGRLEIVLNGQGFFSRWVGKREIAHEGKAVTSDCWRVASGSVTMLEVVGLRGVYRRGRFQAMAVPC